MKRITNIILAFLLSLCIHAQVSRLAENVQYVFSTEGTAGAGDNAPFWFTNNKYGLGTIQNDAGLVRAAIKRDLSTDSLSTWKIGYGLDLVSLINKRDGFFRVQQVYAEVMWKKMYLALGSKQRVSELKHPFLSTGGMVLGMNSRPLPQIRLEIPEFLPILDKKERFSIRGHLAYGCYTDGKWQERNNAGTNYLYTKHSMFNSKALFFKFGNKRIFPLELIFGIELATQFGGRGWNISPYGGGEKKDSVNLGGNLLTALLPMGADINDENYSNAVGNHVGSWHLRLDYTPSNWNIGLYMEHFFDDHSQMFFQYGWKDMLLGLEVNMPKNPYISTFLFEYNSTMHQSGPIFHDETIETPIQISARDDYYNNHIYGAWQTYGFMIGNPLLLSPIYNKYFNYSGSLYPYHSRVRVHHVGLCGKPTSELFWKLLYTHQFSLGTYINPVIEPEKANYLLIGIEYTPQFAKGLSLGLEYGHNSGKILGVSNGVLFNLSFSGNLTKSGNDSKN